MCVRVWYYNYAEPLLQWPGRLAMGVWYAAIPAVASGAGLYAYTRTLHTACVLFSCSKSLHVLQTVGYMTWKTPTHIYQACNQHNSSCCKMETPWQLCLGLAVVGKQVPMGNNRPKFLINGYFVTDRTLYTSSVNLMANNGEKK